MKGKKKKVLLKFLFQLQAFSVWVQSIKLVGQWSTKGRDGKHLPTIRVHFLAGCILVITVIFCCAT